MGRPPTTASEDASISRNRKEKYKNPQGFFPIGQTLMYTANRHNFTFLIPHPNPPPLGEGVYEKRRLCQFAV